MFNLNFESTLKPAGKETAERSNYWRKQRHNNGMKQEWANAKDGLTFEQFEQKTQGPWRVIFPKSFDFSKKKSKIDKIDSLKNLWEFRARWYEPVWQGNSKVFELNFQEDF